MTDPRLHYPATRRNGAPIFDVLRRVLPASGLVLEVNSGSGEHAVLFARNLASLQWQPSDIGPAALASISAHASDAALPNLLPAIEIDVTAPRWPVTRADAVVSINMIHIAPWEACLGLLDGAGRVLPPETGLLYLYGPFKRQGQHTSEGNERFDLSLRAQDPRWGVRNLETVVEAAEIRGLRLAETVEMPANNLSVVFRKTGDIPG
jgi:hypothetical protein